MRRLLTIIKNNKQCRHLDKSILQRIRDFRLSRKGFLQKWAQIRVTLSPDNGRNYSQIQLYNNRPAEGVYNYLNSEGFPQVFDTVRFLAHVTHKSHTQSVQSSVSGAAVLKSLFTLIYSSIHTRAFRTAAFNQRVLYIAYFQTHATFITKLLACVIS